MLGKSELMDILLAVPAHKHETDYEGLVDAIYPHLSDTSEEKARVSGLVDSVRKVVEDTVQETEGPYSWKNNKCRHGYYGHAGCESCVTEYLAKALETFEKAE